MIAQIFVGAARLALEAVKNRDNRSVSVRSRKIATTAPLPSRLGSMPNPIKRLPSGEFERAVAPAISSQLLTARIPSSGISKVFQSFVIAIRTGSIGRLMGSRRDETHG